MFELVKYFHFEAGHQLTFHKGKCAHPHGHSYKLAVHLSSPSLRNSGREKNMVMDFDDLKTVVKKMIDNHLDHKWLNDSLNTDSPTAEFIAQWIFRHLKQELSQLSKITLWETHSSCVTYSE